MNDLSFPLVEENSAPLHEAATSITPGPHLELSGVMWYKRHQVLTRKNSSNPVNTASLLNLYILTI